MSDLAGKLTREPEVRRGHLDPTQNAVFLRNAVKSRIHFNRSEIVGVKLQPTIFRKIRRIENILPVFKAPGACADSYLLLFSQIQNKTATLPSLLSLEKGSVREISRMFHRQVKPSET